MYTSIKGKISYVNPLSSNKLIGQEKVDENPLVPFLKMKFPIKISNLGRSLPNIIVGQGVDKKLECRKGEVNHVSEKQIRLSGNDLGDKKLAKINNLTSLQKVDDEEKGSSIRSEILSKMENILKKYLKKYEDDSEKIRNIYQKSMNFKENLKKKDAEYTQKLGDFKNGLLKKYEEAIIDRINEFASKEGRKYPIFGKKCSGNCDTKSTESKTLFSLICKYRVYQSLSKFGMYCSQCLTTVLLQEVGDIEKALKKAFEQREALAIDIDKMIFECTEDLGKCLDVHNEPTEDRLKFEKNIEPCKEKDRNIKNNLESTNLDKFEQFKNVIFDACDKQAANILRLKEEDNIVLYRLHREIVEIQKKIQNLKEEREKTIENDKINEAVKALIPHIVEAVKNKIFGKDFILDLNQRIDNLASSSENLKFLRLVFSRMLEDGSFLPEFCKNIDDLKNEANKCDLFVYNTLMWPYQRKNEGSCFATAVLMKLWHDRFFQFMQMVADVVKNNKLSFKKMFPNACWVGNGQFKSTRKIGTEVDKYDQVYQKILSPFANLNCDVYSENANSKKDSFRKEISKIFKRSIQDIDKNCARQANNNTYLNSDLFANSIVTGVKDIEWKDGKWNLKVKKEILLKRMKNKNEDLFRNKKYISEEMFTLIESQYDVLVDAIIKNINNRRESGGQSGNILRALGGFNGQYHIPTGIKITSDDKCIFKADDFQKLLDNLRWANINKEMKEMVEGQFLLGRCSFRKKAPKDGEKDEIVGHAFNFVATCIAISDMQIGEKRLIGNLNYEFWQHLYVKKIDNEFVQVIRSPSIDSKADDSQFGLGVINFVLYPNFLVDFKQK